VLKSLTVEGSFVMRISIALKEELLSMMVVFRNQTMMIIEFRE
jgi:hypothetical protein